jgi:tetratricopeptide (TPR) repeat protein
MFFFGVQAGAQSEEQLKIEPWLPQHGRPDIIKRIPGLGSVDIRACGGYRLGSRPGDAGINWRRDMTGYHHIEYRTLPTHRMHLGYSWSDPEWAMYRELTPHWEKGDSRDQARRSEPVRFVGYPYVFVPPEYLVALRLRNSKQEVAMYNRYQGLMESGLYDFYMGRYDQASAQFLAAVSMSPGDIDSRLRAVHALFAVGDYGAAAAMLREALRLQPPAILLNYDIRGEYGKLEDFASHVQQLEAATVKSPGDFNVWLMLGYVRAYSGDRAAAYQALRQAVRLNPRDPMMTRLIRATRPAHPGRQGPDTRSRYEDGTADGAGTAVKAARVGMAREAAR